MRPGAARLGPSIHDEDLLAQAPPRRHPVPRHRLPHRVHAAPTPSRGRRPAHGGGKGVRQGHRRPARQARPRSPHLRAVLRVALQHRPGQPRRVAVDQARGVRGARSPPARHSGPRRHLHRLCHPDRDPHRRPRRRPRRHPARLRGAERGHPRAVRSRLLARHARDHPACDVVGLDAAPVVHGVRPGSRPPHRPVLPARRHPGHRLRRRHHAADPRHAPRGAPPGLRAHGVGQGPRREVGGVQAQPEERHHPRRDDPGHPARPDLQRYGDHRVDLRAARDGPLPLRRHPAARLPGDPGDQPARRVGDRVHEPSRGHALRRSRPAHKVQLMANGIEAVATAQTFPRRRTARLPSALVGLLRFCRRKPLGALGGLCVLALLVMAAGADVIAHYPYDQSVPGARMQPPSAKFWMGTDNLSRDMWSRVVYGARISVTVGFATIALGTLFAAAVGISSAYVGGTYDIVVQRIVDAWMSFPYLVIILSLMAVLGPGLLNLILTLSLLIAAGGARVIRGAALSVMQNPYLEAARAMGSGHLRIVLRYVLPNVMATIMILATIGLGGVILAESSLSFLGFGVPPPYPSWGAMLSGSGRSYMYRAPWMAIWPGLAISLAVFGFNMLGDALRDVLDPRLRGSASTPGR